MGLDLRLKQVDPQDSYDHPRFHKRIIHHSVDSLIHRRTAVFHPNRFQMDPIIRRNCDIHSNNPSSTTSVDSSSARPKSDFSNKSIALGKAQFGATKTREENDRKTIKRSPSGTFEADSGERSSPEQYHNNAEVINVDSTTDHFKDEGDDLRGDIPREMGRQKRNDHDDFNDNGMEQDGDLRDIDVASMQNTEASDAGEDQSATSSSSKTEQTTFGAASGSSPGSRGGRNYQRHNKPPHSYITLIAMAIRDSPTGRVTLAQINDYLRARWPFFRGPYTGWRNSVRHNLSLNECFVKVLRDPARPWGKDNYWTINPHSEYMFLDGSFRRRRRRSVRRSSSSRDPPPPPPGGDGPHHHDFRHSLMTFAGHHSHHSQPQRSLHLEQKGHPRFSSSFTIDNLLGRRTVEDDLPPTSSSISESRMAEPKQQTSVTFPMYPYGLHFPQCPGPILFPPGYRTMNPYWGLLPKLPVSNLHPLRTAHPFIPLQRVISAQDAGNVCCNKNCMCSK